MDPLCTLRILADHYQFWVYDPETSPFEPLPDYTDESCRRGWTRTDHAISFCTQAHLNDHRLDVYLGRPKRLDGFARASIHPLTLSSGRLALHDTRESLICELTAGPYAVVLAAYNLGAEQAADEDGLPDDAFLAHLEWERYELFVFPATELPADGPYGTAA